MLLSFSFLFWLIVLVALELISIGRAAEEISLDLIFLEPSLTAFQVNLAAMIFRVVLLIHRETRMRRDLQFKFARASIIGNLQLILEIALVHSNQRLHHCGVRVIFLDFGQDGLCGLLDQSAALLLGFLGAACAQVLDTAPAVHAFLCL